MLSVRSRPLVKTITIMSIKAVVGSVDCVNTASATNSLPPGRQHESPAPPSLLATGSASSASMGRWVVLALLRCSFVPLR
jgi:hypothetical protein